MSVVLAASFLAQGKVFNKFFQEQAMIFSPISVAVFAGVALLVFGPKRIPELGKSLGKTIRNFKQGLAENSEKSSEAEHITASDKHDSET